jgi:hypothetical protein
MEDTGSISSEEIELVKGRQFETTLGFIPSGTRNYMYTIFNRKTLDRTILFGGASPFHSSSLLLYDFYNHYINNGNDKCSYCMSVILDTKNLKKETDTLNIIELEPSHKLSERKKYANASLKRTWHIFDSIYGSYIHENKKYIKPYRTYVGFKEFLDACGIYNTNKISIKKLASARNVQGVIVNTG